ncbi:hypothetical protein GCM10010363_12610 [Streptomyces omiyaensis]|nr:hypothetical protein GCM10010363_12610 [Streptomyces omiyaensis]
MGVPVVRTGGACLGRRSPLPLSPLPRFHRLPAERRHAILGAARAHFAADGPGTASYHRIIEASGIRKTAAHPYVDGRGDLLAAVLADVLERLPAALGPWTPAADPAGLRARPEAGTGALGAPLRDHPDGLALAARAVRGTEGARGAWTGWFDALVADGQCLGVICAGIDREPLAGPPRPPCASPASGPSAGPPRSRTAPTRARCGGSSPGCGEAGGRERRRHGAGVRGPPRRPADTADAPRPPRPARTPHGPGKTRGESAVEAAGVGARAALLAAGTRSGATRGAGRDPRSPSPP